MRTEKPSVTVHIMNVSKQAGTQDCGQFAIAFMTSLAYGNNPTTEVYRPDEMRAHLSTCFEKRVMQCFPTSKKNTDKQHHSENDNNSCLLYDVDCRTVMIRIKVKKWYAVILVTSGSILTVFLKSQSRESSRRIGIVKSVQETLGFEPLNLHINLN